jgi:5-methylcytosine-specific restriction endonuclease McrA
VCWLDNQPIDYTIIDPHHDGVWEPDHYWPVSTHPQFAEDPANLRASHRECNRNRGNEQHMPSLGTLSRDWFGTLDQKEPHGTP